MKVLAKVWKVIVFLLSICAGIFLLMYGSWLLTKEGGFIIGLVVGCVGIWILIGTFRLDKGK